MYEMNGYIWNVYLVAPSDPILTRSDGSFTVGVCDRETQELYISNMIKGDFLRKVLIHEVCHSAMFSYGIDLDVEQEEVVCDLIATYGDEIFRVADDIFMSLKIKIA